MDCGHTGSSSEHACMSKTTRVTSNRSYYIYVSLFVQISSASFHADLRSPKLKYHRTPILIGNHDFPSTSLSQYSPEQITPASRKCPQSWLPTSTLAHCRIPVSFPKQRTSSRKIGPSLWIPKNALRVGRARLPLPKPRSLHVVWASTLSQLSWQIVPQRPLKQTSTFPSHGAEPPDNRISPFAQLLLMAIIMIIKAHESIMHPIFTMQTQDVYKHCTLTFAKNSSIFKVEAEGGIWKVIAV